MLNILKLYSEMVGTQGFEPCKSGLPDNLTARYHSRLSLNCRVGNKSVGALLTVAFILLCFSPANALDEITWDQIGLEAAYLTLHCIDWGQTLNIADNPDRYWEAVNPILGKHPSRGRVNLYFAATAMAHIAGTILLPSRYRYLWQGVAIGIEACMVRKNQKAEIKVKW